MKIAVCLKQILDPEISPRDFQVDQEKLTAACSGANFVTNIFCENALETALQFQESFGAEITAIAFGPESAEDSLRKALAVKADHACRIDNPGIDHPGSAGAASVLAAAIGKLGEFDLILLGREAGDWGEGRTAGLLAEHLGMPFVSFVDTIQQEGDQLILGRQTDFGRETVNARSPIVLSITNNDANVPRIPKTRDIMKAHRKEITNWTLADLGIEEQSLRQESEQTQIIQLALPEKTSDCEFAAGDSSEEKISDFAQKLANVLSNT